MFHYCCNLFWVRPLFCVDWLDYKANQLQCVVIKGKKVKGAYSSLQACLPSPLQELAYHMGSQCYLPPGRGDIPAFTPAEAGTRFRDPGGMQGWVDLGSWLEMVYSYNGHPSWTNHRCEKLAQSFYAIVPAETRTRDLLIANPTLYRDTTTPSGEYRWKLPTKVDQCGNIHLRSFLPPPSVTLTLARRPSHTNLSHIPSKLLELRKWTSYESYPLADIL